jgi:hypothetical protein
VRGLRRAALAIGIGSVFAALIRLRGSGGSPPQQGGWRELDELALAGEDPAERRPESA